MRQKIYMLSLIFSGTIALLCTVAFLDMSTKGIEVPKELYAILAGSTGVVFGGRFLNPPNGK